MKKFILFLAILFVGNTNLFAVRVRPTAPAPTPDVTKQEVPEDVTGLKKQNTELRKQVVQLKAQLASKPTEVATPVGESVQKARRLADEAISALRALRREEHSDDAHIISLERKVRKLEDEVRTLALELVRYKRQAR